MPNAQPQHTPDTQPQEGGAGQAFRLTADDLREERSRQAQLLAGTSTSEQRLFGEFRRKLATGEALSRAMEKLAEALRFSGRITITFHQGKLTKTTVEESYFRGKHQPTVTG